MHSSTKHVSLYLISFVVVCLLCSAITLSYFFAPGDLQAQQGPGSALAPGTKGAQSSAPAPTQSAQPPVTPMTMPAPGTTPATGGLGGSTGSSTAATQQGSPTAETRPTAVVSSGGQISLNFDDTDVYSVLHTIFGDVLRVNYVIDPKIKGRVTFRSVTPVAKSEVLPIMEVILRLNGIAIVEDAGIYRIVPMSEMQKEPTAVGVGRSSKEIKVAGKALLQVVPIRFLQSTDMVKLLTPFISTGAVIVDVPKSNHLILVDTDANVRRLLTLVETFDSEQQKRKGPQVFVYHVQNGKAKDIASQLQQVFLGSKSSGEKTLTKTAYGSTGTTMSGLQPAPQLAPAPTVSTISMGPGVPEAVVSDSTKILADEVLNAIIVLSTPEDYEVIKDAIVKIDIVPRQVIIEGMIASIYLKNELSLGLAWSIKGSIGDIGTTIALRPGVLTAASLPTSGLTLVGIDSGGAIRAVIQALAADSKAKLLATPHITVSDNKEARIQVGKQVPIVTGETYAAAGVIPQKTIQYKDIGIILKVKPQVNDGGLVNMAISQEVSTYSTIELTTGTKDVIIDKTEASTNLVVQDGHTIIIGGLIREDQNKSFSGIPWLSRIPIIGWLFGGTTDTVERTELVILLTPHVLKSQKDAKKHTSEYVNKFLETGKGDIKPGELLKGDLLNKEDVKEMNLLKDGKENGETTKKGKQAGAISKETKPKQNVIDSGEITK